MSRCGWESIAELCRQHRRSSFYDDGNGQIGVLNHCDEILWYGWTLGGYSLQGSTDTPQGAKLRKLEDVK